MLLNAVSAAMYTVTHFGATNNELLKATFHLDVGDTKIGLRNTFLILASLLNPAHKH